MQQIKTKDFFQKIAFLREELTSFASVVDGYDREYQAVVAKLENSFSENKAFFESNAAEKKEMVSQNTTIAFERLTKMTSDINLLDVQLNQVDKRYAERRKEEVINPKAFAVYEKTEICLEQVERIVKEAKNIAAECYLTGSTVPIQELTMRLTGKRKQLFDKLGNRILEGKALCKGAYSLIKKNGINANLQLEEYQNAEIERVANETAALLETEEKRYKKKLAMTISGYEERIGMLFSEKDIEQLDELSKKLCAHTLIPDDFSEFVLFGTYNVPMGIVADNIHVIELIDSLYHGRIAVQALHLPAILDLRDKANFMFFDERESVLVRNSVHSMIYTLLGNQPASYQKFILYDPEGRAKGFAPYLEFIRNNPTIMYNKIFTTSQQIREQIERLSEFIDEFSQTKLANTADVFTFNHISKERPESLKCLCLLNFPQGFDEQMLESLYNIVKNGNICGVQAILHFDETTIQSSSSTTYIDLINKIKEYCINLQVRDDDWYLENGICWTFDPKPDPIDMNAFFKLYHARYKEATNSVLPIKKIITQDQWFTGDSSELLSVPIGTDENGNVQFLEFGDPISNGTSHHALVTGSLGSGKSTLLHTIIMSAITTYSPDELNLYLLDFKSGTEFQIYANHHIPHIRVIALDAMQEFGQSVLDELVNMMQKRLDLFTKEAKKGNPVKDITGYRKYTGKKMSRILVIADEFQVLFSEAHNRRVANICATRLADIISLYRVCGIHFVLATQTISRLRNGFSVSPSTLSEMHVRIGLKCSEPECKYLFGEEDGKLAFEKMGDTKGTGVYSKNYVVEKPSEFKVAFCDTDTQSELLNTIETKYSFTVSPTKTIVFVGDTVPKLSGCSEYKSFDALEALSNVPIYLGEPIRMDKPVTLHVNRMKRSTLLIVGSERQLSDQIMAVYIRNAIKSKPHLLEIATEHSVYLFDGLTMMGESFAEKVGLVVNHGKNDIKYAKDVFEVLPSIDELYTIYEKRKQQRRTLGDKKISYVTIHVIINDFQWIEPIVLMLNNKSVDDFALEPQETVNTAPSEEEGLFGYLNKSNKNNLLESMDGLIAELSPVAQSSRAVSYHKKLMTLIESGYTYGINVVMSCPDFISIKEIIYECIPKFQNRIVFALSDKDADRIIPEAKVENLKNNIALYYDGINPAYQFKPFDIN